MVGGTVNRPSGRGNSVTASQKIEPRTAIGPASPSVGVQTEMEAELPQTAGCPRSHSHNSHGEQLRGCWMAEGTNRGRLRCGPSFKVNGSRERLLLFVLKYAETTLHLSFF